MNNADKNKKNKREHRATPALFLTGGQRLVIRHGIRIVCLIMALMTPVFFTVYNGSMHQSTEGGLVANRPEAVVPADDPSATPPVLSLSPEIGRAHV